MSPVELDRARRREKETSYLRSIGMPVTVDPTPAIEHAQRLHSLGMTARQMSEQSGLSRSTMYDLIRGCRTKDTGGARVKWIDRADAQAVLSIRFTGLSERGSVGSSLGTRRRIQALAASGWPYRFIGGFLDITDRRAFQLSCAGGQVHAATAARVAKMYEKYADADPADYGVTKYASSRARQAALRNGYAPVHCWDPDTIYDPEAIPEWTGACGTPEGLRIHYREGILPSCGSCLATRQYAQAGSADSTFSGTKLREIRRKRGMELSEIAERLGVNKGTVYYWETGRSAPRGQDRIDQLASLLGVGESDLIED